jgi:hypothetical protein
MEIKTIADWFDVDVELQRQIRGVGYNPDLAKMKRNLDSMITDLSRAEVEARRTKNYRYIQPQIDQINNSIQSLEHWILMLMLEN